MQVYIDEKPYRVKVPFRVSSFLFFSEEVNEFYFNSSQLTPDFGKFRTPLNEIQYLKFNREEYYFDLEKLSMNEANLTRPDKKQISA